MIIERMCRKWAKNYKKVNPHFGALQQEVIVMSNCHAVTTCTILKKSKTGEKLLIDCLETISFYRQKMGGVDRADQFVCLYDYDRKSNKWWKKFFYTCLNMCAINARKLLLFPLWWS